MSPTVKSAHRNSQRGTTLVETLVALLVLSIGLLGVAALQLTSLRNNRSAHLRSQAQVMAYDITDRMRANRDSRARGATTTSLSAPLPRAARWPETIWCAGRKRSRNSLPSGDGSVQVVTPTWC